MQFSTPSPGRPVVMGTHGAVTAGHPQASLAGLEMLQRGGTAADAAVAVAAALNVVEPWGSGLGGDAFILVHEASSGKVHTVNATGPAPRHATIEHFAGGIPTKGSLAASVPGAFSGWVTLQERFGKLDLATALGPAIRLASEGHPVSYNLAAHFREARDTLAQFASSAAVFLANGESPRPGQVLQQHDLAATFRMLAEGGHDAFYRGPVADEIDRAVKDDGGLLDKESLADYRAEVVDAISVDYRGYTVYAAPPNSTGHVLLQELQMFAELDPAAYEPFSPELIHMMVEMKKIAFADRERFNADPRHTGPLPEFLLTQEYARECFGRIDPNRAADIAQVGSGGSENTTYFAVIDRDGNAVSCTTSINGGFGSGFVAGRTGILLNNRMPYWHLDADHPNALMPGKRTRQTIAPSFVTRNGKPAVVIGTPGADGQVQTIFQVLVNLLDYGFNPQAAVEAPRWRSLSKGHESNLPHGTVDELHLDYRFPEATVAGLRERGHNIVPIDRLAMFGSCQAIVVDSEAGVFGAVADSRRDGYALAW